MEVGENGINKMKNRCLRWDDDQLPSDIHLTINSINIYCRPAMCSEL